MDALVPGERVVDTGGAIHLGEAVEGIVGVGDGLAPGIGLGLKVAGGVIGVEGDAPVGAGLLAHLAEGVGLVDGVQAPGVGDGRDAVRRVPGHVGVALEGVLAPGQAAQGVVGGAGGMVQGIGAHRGVALGVVAVFGDGGLAVDAADLLPQPAQGIELPVQAAHRGALGVVHGLVDAVTHAVQGIGDAVAPGVLDAHQAVGGIKAEGGGGAVGQGQTGEVAGRVVGVGGGPAAHGAAHQPAPCVMGQDGDQTVWVPHLGGVAVQVVGLEFRDVAQGVGDLPEPAAPGRVGVVVRVVGVGGDVGHVAAGAVHAGDASQAEVGIGPGAGFAADVVRVRAGEQVAGGVVGGGDGLHQGAQGQAGAVRPAGVGLLQSGQAPGGVPGGGEGAGLGPDLLAAAHHGQTFHPGGFQVAGQVMPIAGAVAVEVVPRGDVAVGVVGHGR